MSLKGRVAIVTGAGSGIGRACGIRLAEDGADVAVWNIDPDSAEETVTMISRSGGRAIACVGYASAEDAIAQLIARTHGELGAVTILVNNAAITGLCPFEKITTEAFDRMISVNLRGPFVLTQRIVPDMLAAHWGRIINISSSSAQSGSVGMTHYGASKGGITGLTKTLAIEFADKGITVNHIPPGFVDTPMLRKMPFNIEATAMASPMKRPGKPEDIAAACAYLASEDAGYVTGQTLSVNGGRYLQ
jgi:2-hydroxycyclohexanecarboxyl-CoA dehydrogenase